MPIVIWKNGAILIYKKAKIIVPIIIAGIGYLVAKLHERWKRGKGEKVQTPPNPEGKST